MKTDKQGQGVAKKCHDGEEGTRKDLCLEGAGKSGCDNMQEEERKRTAREVANKVLAALEGGASYDSKSGLSCVAA